MTQTTSAVQQKRDRLLASFVDAVDRGRLYCPRSSEAFRIVEELFSLLASSEDDSPHFIVECFLGTMADKVVAGVISFEDARHLALSMEPFSWTLDYWPFEDPFGDFAYWFERACEERGIDVYAEMERIESRSTT